MRVVFLCLLVIGQLIGGTRAFTGADQVKRSPQGLSVFAQTGSQFEVGIGSVWGEVQSKESTAISSPQGIATTPPSKTTPTSSGKVIAFEVCSASPAWVRPENKAQMQQLQSTGRYADAKTNREIQNLIVRFRIGTKENRLKSLAKHLLFY